MNALKRGSRRKQQGCASFRPALSLEPLEPRVLLSAQYAITDLGLLSANDVYSQANAVNNVGQVTGYSGVNSISSAFLWQNGSMTNPFSSVSGYVNYNSEGFCINDNGYIALTVQYNTSSYGLLNRAAVVHGSTINYYHYGAAGDESVATSVNDLTTPSVVGYYYNSLVLDDYGNPIPHAFRTISGLNHTVDSRASKANDVNNSNQIVGKVRISNGDWHAALWQGSTFTDVAAGTLSNSEATAINDQSQIVGGYYNAIGDYHAFRWDSQNGLTDLGTIEAGNGYDSNALAINNQGQVVGWSYVLVDENPVTRAFIYDDGKITNLETLIPSSPDWELISATGINDAGQIVGWGYHHNESRAFLLTPIDDEAPTAVAAANNITSAGATTYTFSVTYSDNVALKASTFDNADIFVTGPGNYITLVKFVSANASGNGSTRIVTYKITPPGGAWDYTDNGDYTITMVADQVSDTKNNFVPSGTLTTFNVAITPPIDPATQGACVTAQQPTIAVISGFDYIDLTFNEPINESTLTAADVSLTDPNGDPIAITGVLSLSETMYRIQFASQTAVGDYAISVGPDILDTAGHQMDQDRDGINGEISQDVYSGTVHISPQTAVTIGNGITYIDIGGAKVTLKLTIAVGSAVFAGDNIQIATVKGVTTLTGQNIQLVGIEFSGGTTKSSLTITPAKGAVVHLGSITGDTLNAITAKSVAFIGDITLTGSLGSLTVGDIAAGVSVTTALPAKGVKLTLGNIADADFNFADKITSLTANSFALGSITANQIGTCTIKTGAFGADLLARSGNITSLTAAGDITGHIVANGAINKIITKSGTFSGAARAATDILSLQAAALQNALISAGDNLKKVTITGNVTDSYLLAGYDIGLDAALGLTQIGGDDLLGSGDITGVTIKGTFARSYLTAGVLPHSPLTDAASLPDSAFAPAASGTITGVKLTSVDYNNATADFGLYAATKIVPFKIGKTLAQDNGHFVLR